MIKSFMIIQFHIYLNNNKCRDNLLRSFYVMFVLIKYSMTNYIFWTRQSGDGLDVELNQLVNQQQF